MWGRVYAGLLILAMVASGAVSSRAHLHAANGHRVTDDGHHAGNPAQALWHTHGTAHTHAPDAHHHHAPATSPDDAAHRGTPEDVVSVGAMVVSSPTTITSAPVFMAIVVETVDIEVPVRAWAVKPGELPPAHAPPLIAPRSPRAPPTSALLYA